MKQALLVAVAALAFHAALLVLAGVRHGGGDPRVAYFYGDRQGTPAALAESGIPRLRDSVGYDGEFYLMIATDPLLRTRGAVASIDEAAYRYRRIGVPAAAAALCMGTGANCVSWTIPLILLLSIGVGTFALARFAEHLALSSWWGFAFAAMPAVLIGLPRLLPDVASAAFVVAALVAWYRARYTLAIVSVVAATLVRETALLVALTLALDALRQRNYVRAAKVLIAPSVVIAAWVLYVRSRVDQSTWTSHQFGLPFAGIAEMLVALVDGASELGTRINNALAFVGMIGCTFYLARVWWRKRDDFIASLGLIVAAVACFATFPIWEIFIGFARAFDAITLACVMVGLRDRDKKAILPVAITLIPCVVNAFVVSLRGS